MASCTSSSERDDGPVPRAVAYSILRIATLIIALSLLAFRLFAAMIERLPSREPISRIRTREVLNVLRPIAARADRRTILFAGTSHIEFGLDPIELDRALAKRGDDVVSYNIGVAGKVWYESDRLALRLAEAMRATAHRAGTLVFEAQLDAPAPQPLEQGLERESGLILSSPSEVARDIVEFPQMGIQRALRKYVAGGITADYLLARTGIMVSASWLNQEAPLVARLGYREFVTSRPADRPFGGWAWESRGQAQFRFDPDVYAQWEKEVRATLPPDDDTEALPSTDETDRGIDNFLHIADVLLPVADRIVVYWAPVNPAYPTMLKRVEAQQKRFRERVGKRFEEIDLLRIPGFTANDFSDNEHTSPDGSRKLARVLAEHADVLLH